jgi:ATP-dependent Lon protease
MKNDVTPRNLKNYLGKRVFIDDIGSLEPEVGVTTGMAWTSVGGVTLTIESVRMPGSGKLVLTGQMGDVMKESATTALGYIKSISGKYKIGKDVFKDYDIQIHIPEGATPKDGPSAGITMVSSMVSALRGQALKSGIAMTGEMTLRGRVLPVGGIKEKILAAKRAGVRTIVISEENRKDIEDIKEIYVKGLTFVYVKDIAEVIDAIF